MKLARRLCLPFAIAALATIGCSEGSDVDSFGPITRRAGSVVVEGCALTEAQQGTLASSATKQVLQTVILLCGGLHDDGSIGAVSGSNASTVAQQVQSLQAEGYRVSIGITIGADGLDQTDGPTALSDLQSSTWPGLAVASIQSFAHGADGVELVMPPMDEEGSGALAAFVQQVSNAIRPSMQLGLFAPPSTQSPSDVAGGDAYALDALLPAVDHLRLMTLDFSCCGAGPGPTIDPGWAVDAARFAALFHKGAPIDVAYPLYGYDFAPDGTSAQGVSFAAATQIASQQHAVISRGPTGAETFDYDGDDGPHEVWFDDALSTTRALRAWDASTLPANVGVVYYGLGDEDPALWQAIVDGEGR